MQIKSIQTKDFDFQLPESQIALYPTEQRTHSRLLVLNPQVQTTEHLHFYQIIDKLQPNDLLVFNNTRVIPARLYGKKETGAQVEILIERVLDAQRALVHIKANRAPKAGSSLILEETIRVEVLERQGGLFILRFDSSKNVFTWLDECGHMPLPPYIQRADEEADQERYQTVYGTELGAVAAPTAGLHFDDKLLAALKSKGIRFAYVTLHVGAGTFQPVRVDNILEHTMHSEAVYVPEETVQAVAETKQQGGRIVAVGTTSVRSLEAAAASGQLRPLYQDTDIFIYPGYTFRVVDALITNFHLPESTLVMLVSALAGRETTLQAYQEAITQGYRFYSYGDSMFIECGIKNNEG